jgi:hypothetical protein
MSASFLIVERFAISRSRAGSAIRTLPVLGIGHFISIE